MYKKSEERKKPEIKMVQLSEIAVGGELIDVGGRRWKKTGGLELTRVDNGEVWQMSPESSEALFFMVLGN